MSSALDFTRIIRTDPGTVPDSETQFQNVQNRVWATLKKNYDYAGVNDESERFLERNVSHRFNSAILYVDLVGSTQLALDLPPSNLIPIMASFVQEMGNVVVAHHGLVLKFMGDAVIGYFVDKGGNVQWSVEHAVGCAETMLEVIKRSMNPVLTQYDYPELQIKVGIDYGLNIAVRYGKIPKRQHLDMMGRSMNMAAKIQARAKPNQILVGTDVYVHLHPETQKKFEMAEWSKTWPYHAVKTGKTYEVYAYRGSRAPGVSKSA